MNHRTIQRRKNVAQSLFSQQVSRIRGLGYPDIVIKKIELHFTAILDQVVCIELKADHIAFLPIIPFTYRSIYDQMAAVFPWGKEGYTELNPAQIVDIENVPKEPYFTFDIALGKATATPPQRAVDALRSKGRCPLTASEIISIGIFSDPFKRFRSLFAGGTSYGGYNKLLGLTKIGSAPHLVWTPADEGDAEWRMPSCSRRL